MNHIEEKKHFQNSHFLFQANMIDERHYYFTLNFEIDLSLLYKSDYDFIGSFVQSVPDEAMVQCHTGERRGLSRLCDAYR